jgi:polysaccharide export outer membrane protein
MNCSTLKGVVLGLIVVSAGSLSCQAPSSTGEHAPAANPTQSDADANRKPHDENFIIGNDDLLAISVWKEPELTKSVPVRSDGKISLPLVGELQATGRSPLQLELDITEKLKNFITTPEVTVIVQEVRSRKFNLLGEVLKPGEYPLTASTTIVDAIALAGGFKDFAKRTGVYVLRKGPDGSESHLKFNYKDFIKGKNTSQNIKVEPNDTIIVP